MRGCAGAYRPPHPLARLRRHAEPGGGDAGGGRGGPRRGRPDRPRHRAGLGGGDRGGRVARPRPGDRDRGQHPLRAHGRAPPGVPARRRGPGPGPRPGPGARGPQLPGARDPGQPARGGDRAHRGRRTARLCRHAGDRPTARGRRAGRPRRGRRPGRGVRAVPQPRPAGVRQPLRRRPRGRGAAGRRGRRGPRGRAPVGAVGPAGAHRGRVRAAARPRAGRHRGRPPGPRRRRARGPARHRPQPRPGGHRVQRLPRHAARSTTTWGATPPRPRSSPGSASSPRAPGPPGHERPARRHPDDECLRHPLRDHGPRRHRADLPVADRRPVEGLGAAGGVAGGHRLVRGDRRVRVLRPADPGLPAHLAARPAVRGRPAAPARRARAADRQREGADPAGRDQRRARARWAPRCWPGRARSWRRCCSPTGSTTSPTSPRSRSP